MLIRSAVLLTCLVAAPALAQDGQASFDCNKTRTPIEKAICDGPNTADLDRAMAEHYRAALVRRPADRAAIEAEQRRWLAARDARCGRTKPDTACLERIYQDRIVALARANRPPDAPGNFITGRYEYRQQGEAGSLFLAEMPDGTTLVMIETVNVGHRSPHMCNFAQRPKDRRGDVLTYRNAEESKDCGLEIAVSGNRATVRETPKECFGMAQYYCGAHGYMLGTYAKR